MFLQAWKVLGVLLAFVFTNYGVEGNTCTWKGKEPGLTACTSLPYEIDCVSTVTYNLKPCEDRTNYYNFVVTDKYDMIINLINPSVDPFLEDVSQYVKLTVKDGYLLTIPKDVFKMKKLTEITISGNKLRNINFNDFLPLSSLKKINLSKNTLCDIDIEVVSSSYSTVRDIDISYNLIEAVPNYFVQRFSELEHLNLSNNVISSIDVHAFMGPDQLQKLKTLDLTNNRLFEIGNVFAKLPSLTQLLLDDNFIRNISFTAFFNTGITEISIGRNLIPCGDLLNMKYSNFSEKFNNVVTAKTLNYHYENVNGITCQNATNDISSTIFVPGSSNANIGAMILMIKSAIEKNSKSIDALVETVHKNDKTKYSFTSTTEASPIKYDLDY